MGIEFKNIDCMDFMAEVDDSYFDLAVVDPPYGIGMAQGYEDRYESFFGGDRAIPEKRYFDELYRVSKNQVIWGGNYFGLGPCKCFLIWDKVLPEKFSMAMCEYAWTSFNSVAKIYKLRVAGHTDKERIHPTQKPVKLYSWILDRYAKKGQKIIDTHLGSGSSAIAAHNFGVDFVGCEIDPHYFSLSKERFFRETAQSFLF